MVEPATDVARAAALGQGSFPGVQLALDVFQRRVEAMGVRPEDLARRGDEVYLAAACLEGDGAALAHFDRAYLSRIDSHVAKLRLEPPQVEDLRQQLRIQLVWGKRPGLSTYSGRAPLQGWLRIVALRAAMTLVSRENRDVAVPDALEELVAMHASPEVIALRQDLRGAFQDALRQALASLAPQERTLLRLHFLDQLTVDAIARIYQIHKATAARRLVGLRTQLFDQIRRHLALDLAPSPTELRSLFRLVQSELHVSVARLLSSKS